MLKNTLFKPNNIVSIVLTFMVYCTTASMQYSETDVLTFNDLTRVMIEAPTLDEATAILDYYKYENNWQTFRYCLQKESYKESAQDYSSDIKQKMLTYLCYRNCCIAIGLGSATQFVSTFIDGRSKGNIVWYGLLSATCTGLAFVFNMYKNALKPKFKKLDRIESLLNYIS